MAAAVTCASAVCRRLRRPASKAHCASSLPTRRRTVVPHAMPVRLLTASLFPCAPCVRTCGIPSFAVSCAGAFRPGKIVITSFRRNVRERGHPLATLTPPAGPQGRLKVPVARLLQYLKRGLGQTAGRPKVSSRATVAMLLLRTPAGIGCRMARLPRVAPQRVNVGCVISCAVHQAAESDDLPSGMAIVSNEDESEFCLVRVGAGRSSAPAVIEADETTSEVYTKDAPAKVVSKRDYLFGDLPQSIRCAAASA